MCSAAAETCLVGPFHCSSGCDSWPLSDSGHASDVAMLAAAYPEGEGRGEVGEGRGHQGLAPLPGARVLKVSHMVSRWLPTAGDRGRAGAALELSPAAERSALAPVFFLKYMYIHIYVYINICMCILNNVCIVLYIYTYIYCYI